VEVSRPQVVVKTMAGFFTPRSQLETLLRDIEDEDARFRADAAYELGFVKDPRSSKALREALRDKNEKVRVLSVGALARLGDEEAIPALVKVLGDKTDSVRDAALEAVRQFGPAAMPALIVEVTEGARAWGIRPQTPNAARLLGLVGDDRACEPLALLLRRMDRQSRIAAAEALGNLGFSQGIPPLRTALTDIEPEVRVAALRSIATIAGKAARTFIEDYLRRETDPGVQQAGQALLSSL
jgi:HEAT repeat protein